MCTLRSALARHQERLEQVVLSNVEAKPRGRADANGCGRSASWFLGAQPEHSQLDVSEVITPGSARLRLACGLQNPISVQDNWLQ